MTTESEPLTVRHLQPGTQETRGVVPSDGQAGGRGVSGKSEGQTKTSASAPGTQPGVLLLLSLFQALG